MAYAPGLVLPWGPGKPQPESLELVWGRYPDFNESFLAGGLAQEKALDNELGVASRCDWLATATALYYVAWQLESVFRWAWSDIETARIARRRLAFARLEVRIKSVTHPLSFKISKPAADNLTAIIDWIWNKRAKAVEPVASNPPPNWYADTSGTHKLRYWDGARWTEHYAD